MRPPPCREYTGETPPPSARVIVVVEGRSLHDHAPSAQTPESDAPHKSLWELQAGAPRTKAGSATYRGQHAFSRRVAQSDAKLAETDARRTTANPKIDEQRFPGAPLISCWRCRSSRSRDARTSLSRLARCSGDCKRTPSSTAVWINMGLVQETSQSVKGSLRSRCQTYRGSASTRTQSRVGSAFR